MPGAWAPSTSVSIAAAVQLAHQLLDRKDQGRGAGDVIQQGQPRAGRHLLKHGVDAPAAARSIGSGSFDFDHDRPAAPGNVADDVAAGVVVVGRHEDFVARPEIERPQHGVDARRWRSARRPSRPDRRRSARRASRATRPTGRQPPHEELDRLPLHLRRRSCCRPARPAGRPRTSRG